MVMVVTCTAVPCSRKVMKLMMPKSARKSPKMLMSCAAQIARKPGSRNTLAGRGAACASEVIRRRLRLFARSSAPAGTPPAATSAHLDLAVRLQFVGAVGDDVLAFADAGDDRGRSLAQDDLHRPHVG